MSNGNSPQPSMMPVDSGTERLKLILQFLTLVVTTFGTLGLAYIGVRQSSNAAVIKSVEDKVDVAAVHAEVAAKKAAEVKVVADESTKTALNTNAALHEWKASYTKAPEDMYEAEKAKERLEALNKGLKD